MKTYRKTATVQAKIFEPGDEDGFIYYPEAVPYIRTLENQKFRGEFNENYLCVGVDGERWLVEKSIFERTYEVIKTK